MKNFSILLIIMPLFILSSCTVIYPSLPNAYIEDIPSDGVEVYCYKDKNNWFCGATSSNIKTEEEIRSLQFVNLLEMKKILKSKGLYKHFTVIIVDLSGEKVEFLIGEEHERDRIFLINKLSN